MFAFLCEVQSTQRKDVFSDANYTRVEKVESEGYRIPDVFWVVGLWYCFGM